MNNACQPVSLPHRVSQHHYSGSFCMGQGGLLQDLMAKTGVRSNITQYVGDISATLAQGLTYIFGESNSYACHGTPGELLSVLFSRRIEDLCWLIGVSNTAGAAVWAVDFALQAASRSITRVHFHNGIGYKYNLVSNLLNSIQACTHPFCPR